MKKQPMPAVNMEQLKQILTAAELDIVIRFIKKNNTIRASKPKVTTKVVRTERVSTKYGSFDKEFFDCENENQGKAAYVWRHVVFAVSPKSAHQCVCPPQIFLTCPIV